MQIDVGVRAPRPTGFSRLTAPAVEPISDYVFIKTPIYALQLELKSE